MDRNVIVSLHVWIFGRVVQTLYRSLVQANKLCTRSHDVNVREGLIFFHSTHHWVLNDGYRADYWLPASSVRCNVELRVAGKTLIHICIIVQPLTRMNSLLAVDINTWNVMVLGTINNQLTINLKNGKCLFWDPLPSPFSPLRTYAFTCVTTWYAAQKVRTSSRGHQRGLCILQW